MKLRERTIMCKLIEKFKMNFLIKISSLKSHNHPHDVDVPTSLDGDDVQPSSTYGARFSISSIIALSSFGAFVFLAALITTIVVIVRR